MSQSRWPVVISHQHQAVIISSKNDMDSFEDKKLAHIECWLYFVGEINYRHGFPNFDPNYRKRLKLFSPWALNILATILLIKVTATFFITEEFHRVIIGDFTYNLSFGKQFNL